MARFAAATAVLLLLALGSANAQCNVNLAKCNTSLKNCRTTLTTRISTGEACATRAAACTIARNKCTKDLAVSNEQRATLSSSLTAAVAARNSCNAALTKTTAERNTCNARLLAASTELTQGKNVITATLAKWGVSTTGRDLSDISNALEFLLANLKESPEFKEEASILNTLVSGLNDCGLGQGGLTGLLDNLLGCVGNLLSTLGL